MTDILLQRVTNTEMIVSPISHMGDAMGYIIHVILKIKKAKKIIQNIRAYYISSDRHNYVCINSLECSGWIGHVYKSAKEMRSLVPHCPETKHNNGAIQPCRNAGHVQ